MTSEELINRYPNCTNWRDIPVAVLRPSVRLSNCLVEENVSNIHQLINYPPLDWFKVSNFGPKSFAELKDKLSEFGFALQKVSKKKVWTGPSRPNAVKIHVEEPQGPQQVLDKLKAIQIDLATAQKEIVESISIIEKLL